MARFRDLQKMFSDCMRHQWAERPEMPAKNAPVAQLDRALDYESRGQEFESLRARQLNKVFLTFLAARRVSLFALGTRWGRKVFLCCR